MRMVFTLIVGLLFAGCDISENSALTNYCNKKILSTKVDYRVEQPKLKITYLQHIKPSIDQHCMNCHSAGQQRPDLTLWEDIKKADFKLAKLIVKKVREDDMPKVHPLDEAGQDMYAEWQAGGFLHTQDMSGQMDCSAVNPPMQPVINSADEAKRREPGSATQAPPPK